MLTTFKETPSRPSSSSLGGSPRPRKPIRVHRPGHVKARRWGETKLGQESTKTLYGVKHNGISPETDLLECRLTLCIVTRKSIHPKSRDHRIEKCPVGPNLGGTDPFGAFQLPQHSNTDRALHHCKDVLSSGSGRRIAWSDRTDSVTGQGRMCSSRLACQ